MHKNTFLIIFTLIIAIFALTTACNDDDDDDDDFSETGTNLSISDIQGSWIATSATFTAPEFIDILAQGEGVTVTLVIQPNGRFTFSMMMPGSPGDVTTGKLGFDGEFLAVRFDDDPDDEASFFISLTNNILTLRGQTELDLDGNDVDDFGTLELIMNRN